MAKGKEGNKIRTITCMSCGTIKTDRMRPDQRYCSLTCYRSSSRPARKTGTERVCESCKTVFYVPRSRAEVARFCSTACADVWQGRSKSNHVCKMCGTSFRWSPSRQKNNTVTYCSIPCRDADPSRREQLLAMSEAQGLKNPTTPERIGYAILDKLGVPYERQACFGTKFVVDTLVRSVRLVIQFDGDYWHDRKGTSTEPRIRKHVRRDRSQEAYLRVAGWRVLRLWESDLKKRPDWCEQQITEHLRLPSEVQS